VRGTTIGRSYAETLFALAERHGQHAEFAQASRDVAVLLESEPRIRTFLETPKINVRAKKDAVRQALAERVPQLFLNFVNVVLDKRRESLLPEIAEQYQLLLDEHLGRVHAQVTLARQPSPEMEQEITDRLSVLIGKTVVSHVRVDAEILGGVVVRYGDHVLDGSLRRRLLALRNRLRQAAVPMA
jgi:F-type H+-transporting ATPase subunit delta